MRVRIPSEIPIWPKKSRKELKTPAPFHEKENGEQPFHQIPSFHPFLLFGLQWQAAKSRTTALLLEGSISE
jgi:hypothetical protein